jgi:hypothetical protein
METDYPHELFPFYKELSNEKLVETYNALIVKKCLCKGEAQDKRMRLAVIKCVLTENKLDYSQIFSINELDYILETDDYSKYISCCEDGFLSQYINTENKLRLVGMRLILTGLSTVPERSTDRNPFRDFLINLQEQINNHSVLSNYRFKVSEGTYQSYIFNEFKSFDLVCSEEFQAEFCDNRIPIYWGERNISYRFEDFSENTDGLVAVFVTPEKSRKGNYSFVVCKRKGVKASLHYVIE